MNSSSEPFEPSFCVPLQYRDAREPFEPGQTYEPAAAPAAQSADPSPDPAELLAARIAEERRVITAQARQETERELQRIRSEIASSIEQFAQQRDEYFRQAEAEVVSLALAIARRLVHRETQIDPHLLAGLVKYELEQLETATSVRLFISPDALSYWNEAVRDMPRPVELAPDKALAAGDVRIETVLGSTTVSFERELKEIERGFFDLLSHRPASAESRTLRVQ
jgi:flagellar assembly protein FliH